MNFQSYYRKDEAVSGKNNTHILKLSVGRNTRFYSEGLLSVPLLITAPVQAHLLIHTSAIEGVM
jgi:multisubunit Na+/H+ antiporter MnhG subunit